MKIIFRLREGMKVNKGGGKENKMNGLRYLIHSVNSTRTV